MLVVAAVAGGNGVAVRAGGRVAEETANALVQFGRDDVFEFTGLAVRFVIIDPESVFEQAFGEAMTADDIASPALAAIGQFDLTILEHMDQAKVFHAGERADRVDTAGSADVSDVGTIALFAANPDLLEEMIEVDTVVHGDALVDGEVAVNQLDAAVSLLGNVRVVRDHEDRVSGAMQLTKQADDDFFVGFVEVARGFIGQDELRLID